MPRNQLAHGTKPKASGIWILALVVLVVLVVAFFGWEPLGNPLTRGDNIASINFTLPELTTSTTRNLSDYRGKYVLVNLWASWCGPCRKEIPDLVNFFHAHQNQDLVVLAINTSDSHTPALQFVQEHPMPFVILFDPNSTVLQKLGANGLPASYLIDRSGKVKFSWTGQISPEILEQRVAPLLTQ